jgi:DNA-binding transcriptional regulator GbsR (MarR family)
MAAARSRQSKTKGPARVAGAITPDEAAFVEEVAILYESFGLPRMSGRVLAWLLICEPAHQSLADLGRVLHASKGSISTMTRLLLQIGLIKRLSVAGDRRDYVVIPEGWLSSLVDSQLQRTILIRKMAENGLKLLDGEPPARSGRLREMRDLYAFFERETPALLTRWKKERKRT